MIPRRRIEIAPDDILDLMAAPFVADQRNRDVAAFETALSNYLVCRHVRCTGSGRDALRIILAALELQPGDEILVPAYTLGELVPFLQGEGYRLVAADVDPASYNVTPETVAAALGPSTRALLVLHTFGAPCDITAICELARAHNIPVIEDCAHALGATAGTHKLGTFGTAAFFSLEVNKPVATFGGGIITTANPDLAVRIDRLLDAQQRTEWPAIRKAALKMTEELAVRSPLYPLAARLMFSGQRSSLIDRHYRRFHDRVRMLQVAYSGFQARIGLRRLRQLDARNARLNALWQNLRQRLAGTPFSPQVRDRHGTPAFYNFAATYSGKLETMRRQAQQRGIDIAIRGEVMDDAAALLGQSNCQNTAALFDSVALLPLHNGISPSRLGDMANELIDMCGALQ